MTFFYKVHYRQMVPYFEPVYVNRVPLFRRWSIKHSCSFLACKWRNRHRDEPSWHPKIVRNLRKSFANLPPKKDTQIDRGRKELAIQNLEFHFISLPSPNCAMLVEIIRKSLPLEFTRISPFVATLPSVNKKRDVWPPFPRVERRGLFDGSWKSQLKKKKRESRWYWTTCCAYTKGCKRVRHRIEGYIDVKLLTGVKTSEREI